MPRFGKRSKRCLAGCHKDLQKVANEAIKLVDFSVISGHRGRSAQNAVYDKGFSKARFPNSKHNKTPSEAFDFIPYPFTDWGDVARFAYIAGVIICTAARLGIKLKWGGHFKNWKDYGHIQKG